MRFFESRDAAANKRGTDPTAAALRVKQQAYLDWWELRFHDYDIAMHGREAEEGVQ